MAGKIETVSRKKVEDYISKANVSIQQASFMIGASHDYLNSAIRSSSRGQIKISENYFNEFCKVFNADPNDLRVRPYNRKEHEDKCVQMEFEWGDESSSIEVSDVPSVESVSMEADIYNGVKEMIHDVKIKLSVIEAALSEVTNG